MRKRRTKAKHRLDDSTGPPQDIRLIAYIDDKNAGAFGHGERERRKFATRLNGEVNHDG
jgi:hypothetical protein